jgi:hypothetical protein
VESIEFQVDKFAVTITVTSNEDVQLLQEARRRGEPLGGPYSAIHHTPRFAQAQHHLHIFKRGTEICSVNQDGSGHDGFHGFQLPNKVADAIRQQFPTWRIAPDNIIESIEPSRYRVEIARLLETGATTRQGEGSTVEAIFKAFVAEACCAESANDPFWQKLLAMQRNEITTVDQMFKRWRQLAGLEN